jgi:hypothetical protein
MSRYGMRMGRQRDAEVQFEMFELIDDRCDM